MTTRRPDQDTGPRRQDQLPGLEQQPSLFGADDRDLLDAIAAQATDADRDATAHLLKLARTVRPGESNREEP